MSHSSSPLHLSALFTNSHHYLYSVSKNAEMKDGDYCLVTGGTHKGKQGKVTDIHTSKTGAVTITVVQDSGVRFKTLAKNVEIRN